MKPVQHLGLVLSADSLYENGYEEMDGFGVIGVGSRDRDFLAAKSENADSDFQGR